MKPRDIFKMYYHFAVVGVTENKDKYGYKIYKRLKDRSLDVYGISPKYEEIDGDQIYSSLESIQAPIDVVVFIVRKEFVYEYLDEMTSLGIRYAWMQPNTYDDELLDHMRSVGITPITACVLIETSL